MGLGAQNIAYRLSLGFYIVKRVPCDLGVSEPEHIKTIKHRGVYLNTSLNYYYPFELVRTWFIKTGCDNVYHRNIRPFFFDIIVIS